MKQLKKCMTWILVGAMSMNFLMSCSSSGGSDTTTGSGTSTPAASSGTNPATGTTNPTTKPATDPVTSATTGSATNPVSTPGSTVPVIFDPASIEGLLIWYVASSLTGADGDRIEELKNLAGEKYNAKVNGSGYATLAKQGIGGLPALDCGKQTSFTVEDSTKLKFHDFTIVSVILPETYAQNNDQNQIFSKLASGGAYDHQWYYNINGAGNFNSGWKDSSGAYMDFGSASAALTMNQSYMLLSAKGGNSSELYINGAHIGTLTSGVSTVALNSDPIYIGGNGSYSQCMDGKIGEILLIEGTLDKTQIFTLLQYLSEKWGITMDKSGFIPENTELSVSVGGEEIRELSLSKTDYVRSLAAGSTSAPTITASCTVDGKPSKCTVTQAESATGSATVYLDELDITYTVKFRVLEKETAQITPADVTEVELLDGFWKELVEMYASKTIDTVFDHFVAQGALRNFEKVIKGSGSPENNPWLDGLLFETITAAGDFLAVYEDPDLKAKVDSYIDVVYRASMSSKNGYLSTHAMLAKPGQYFDDHGEGVWYHECYNFGCMAEAAVHYYKATGETKLLFVALRYAEFIADNYGYGVKADGTPKINMVPSHSLTEEALLELYRLLRDTDGLVAKMESYDPDHPLSIQIEEYADLVKFWIENRGNADGRVRGILYGKYAQDDLYYFDQVVAEGHAVRANLFYTGIAAAGREFGNLTYLQTAENLWTNIVNKQMYVTGGVGATKADEAYADDYDLPNDGYCETCAQVAMAFFSEYLSESFEDSRYADTIERLMYNGILGCTSLSGDRFYYTQPINSVSHDRWEWHDCACCPPMFLKFYSTLANYIYSYTDKTVYVNQFVSSKLHNGNRSLTLTTDMPWSGKSVIEITGGSFELAIRIPDWAKDCDMSLTVNGKATTITERNGFAVLQVKKGDKVEYTLTLTPVRVYADEHVAADRGRVAFTYGPLVYCVESTDNTNIQGIASGENSIKISTTAPLSAKYDASLLGGVVKITTKAIRNGKEYDCTLIPFYARANRGSCSAYVWIQEQK